MGKKRHPVIGVGATVVIAAVTAMGLVAAGVQHVTAQAQEVKSVKEEVHILTSDVAGLKRDVAEIRGDVAGLKRNAVEVQGALSAIREWQGETGENISIIVDYIQSLTQTASASGVDTVAEKELE